MKEVLLKSKKNIISRFSKTFLAFTLAEVLIVIGIIGIVAEIVIPGVIANAFDSYSLAMVKKDFSIIQQAIKMAELNEGRICDWYSGSSDAATANITANQVLSKYLKVSKNCGATQGCFSPNNYRWLSSSNTLSVPNFMKLDNYPSQWSNMILADGSSLAIWASSIGGSSPNSYISSLTFVVDVNGLKEPNRWGYDTFQFFITSSPDANSSKALEAWGYRPNNTGFNGCYSNAAPTENPGFGVGCAVWAIYGSTVKYKNGEILP